MLWLRGSTLLLRFGTIFLPFLVRFLEICFHSIIQKIMKNYKRKKNEKGFFDRFSLKGPLKTYTYIYAHAQARLLAQIHIAPRGVFAYILSGAPQLRTCTHLCTHYTSVG